MPKIEDRHTCAMVTRTTIGLIPHLEVHGMRLPVKVVAPEKSKGLPAPLIVNDRYVYALPGGGDYYPR